MGRYSSSLACDVLCPANFRRVSLDFINLWQLGPSSHSRPLWYVTVDLLSTHNSCRLSYGRFTGTDVASSFCIPAEAVVSSLKHCRSGSSAPVFVAVDTRSAAAFGRRRLPTALHVPVLAEDTVTTHFLFLLLVARTRSNLFRSGSHTAPSCESHNFYAASHREASSAQWQTTYMFNNDVIL